MAQKTAVEWLAKELESYGDPQLLKITWDDLDSLIEQAKGMENKQKGYSKEEVISIHNEWLKFDAAQDSYNGQDDLTFAEWFNQFKKK